MLTRRRGAAAHPGHRAERAAGEPAAARAASSFASRSRCETLVASIRNVLPDAAVHAWRGRWATPRGAVVLMLRADGAMDPERLRALLEAVQRRTRADRRCAARAARAAVPHARVRARRHPPPPAHRLSRGRARRGQDARADRRHPGRARRGAARRCWRRACSPEAAAVVHRRGCPAARYLPVPRARRARPDAGARSRARADRGRQRRDRRHPGRRGGGADRRAGRQPRRAPLRRRRRRAAPPARAPRADRAGRDRSSSSPAWRARCPASSRACSRGR